MTQNQTERRLPTLEQACRKIAEEIIDEATSLADLTASLAKDLNRGESFALLKRLSSIAKQLHCTSHMLCAISDQKSNIQ